MRSRVHFTICSMNYFAYALTLRESFKRVSPDEEFLIFLSDSTGDFGKEHDFVIDVKGLDFPSYWEMAAKYNIVEFNTAIKPFIIKYLFLNGFSQVLYLDPDIFIFRELEEIYELLDAGASAVFTPHILEALSDDRKPNDYTILKTGIYNLGFCAFSFCQESIDFLIWWQDKCRTQCIVDLESGIFVDQKFCDLAPTFMPNSRILYHPGYNVAYWNLENRPLEYRKGKWYAKEEPLHFFHFSGVMPDNREVLSKHTPAFSASKSKEIKKLLNFYIDELFANEHSDYTEISYDHDCNSSGEKIPYEYRVILRKKGLTEDNARRFFHECDHAYFAQPAEDLRDEQLIDVPEIIGTIYRRRPDVRSVFPIKSNPGRKGLIKWFLNTGHEEHHIPEPCVQAVREWFDSYQAREEGAAQENHGSQRGKIARKGAAASRTVARRVLPSIARQTLRRVMIDRRASVPEEPVYSRPSSAPPQMTFGVGLFGHLSAETGVGEGARNASRALSAASVPHSIHPISTFGVFHEPEAVGDGFSNESNFPISLFHVNADQTLKLQELVGQTNLSGRYKIGYWAWELSAFPEAWHPAIELVDEIWTPSQFVARSLERVSSKPVHVMPHPIARRPARNGQDINFVPSNRFRVLTIFDLNSFIERKNPMGAVKAFQQAFPDNEDVQLIIKMHGGRGEFTEERALLRRITQGDPRIAIIDRVLSRKAMDRIQESADCFISLHRSEGFGLNIAEMMALGRPVVATGYSGNCDFLKADTGFPVSFTLTEIPPGAYPYGEGQQWAEPSIAHAADHLRYIYSNREAARTVASAGKKMIEEEFSFGNIGLKMEKRLREVYQQHSSARISQG